jgi:hypothetical protein
MNAEGCQPFLPNTSRRNLRQRLTLLHRQSVGQLIKNVIAKREPPEVGGADHCSADRGQGIGPFLDCTEDRISDGHVDGIEKRAGRLHFVRSSEVSSTRSIARALRFLIFGPAVERAAICHVVSGSGGRNQGALT